MERYFHTKLIRRKDYVLIAIKERRPMRIIEDIVCVILLWFLPNYVLDKLGLYDSMIAIINDRKSEVMPGACWK